MSTLPAPSLALVVLRAKQPERLAGFYGRLGLHFVKERHGNGPEHLACQMGETIFEIYPCTRNGEGTAQTRIGLGVPDLNAAIAGLPSDCEMLRPPAMTDWGRRCVLRDPEGHKVELIERP